MENITVFSILDIPILPTIQQKCNIFYKRICLLQIANSLFSHCFHEKRDLSFQNIFLYIEHNI